MGRSISHVTRALFVTAAAVIGVAACESARGPVPKSDCDTTPVTQQQPESRNEGVVQVPAKGQAPATALGTPYRFEHLQTGGRRLRGGAFPVDANLLPKYPDGITRLPDATPGLRVGTVRLPKSTMEPGAKDGGSREVVSRLLAIDPRSGGGRAVVFWFDANGDGDLTDEPVLVDAEAKPFAYANKELTGVLSNLSTGTIRVAGEIRQYVWARHAESDSYYLFLSQSEAEFDWSTAVASHLELAPVPDDVRRLWPSSLSGVLRIGNREAPRKYFVILHPPSGEVDFPLLIIDLNADGVVDEEPVRLARSVSGPDGKEERWTGTATLKMIYPTLDGDIELLSDIAVEVRPPFGGRDGPTYYSMTFRGEWGRRGTVDLGAGAMNALLFDEMALGDYRGSLGGNDSGVRLLVDLNKDGKFARGEAFDPSKTFRALDASWIVRDLEASGASFRLERLDTKGGAGESGSQTR